MYINYCIACNARTASKTNYQLLYRHLLRKHPIDKTDKIRQDAIIIQRRLADNPTLEDYYTLQQIITILSDLSKKKDNVSKAIDSRTRKR